MASDGDVTVRGGGSLAAVGFDGVAIKPTEVDPERAAALATDRLVFDFEGREHVPSAAVLERLAADREVRVTAPVRADGFDPTGDDARLRALPEAVDLAFVAGHPAYLAAHERRKGVAERLAAAAAGAADPWIGTESVERLALAVGGTQFELLAGDTERTVRSLRAAGFDRDVAVYAPTVLSEDADVVLDAVGDYVARRPAVRERLPPNAAVDAAATGEVREELLRATREFAIVGDRESVADQVASLKAAGVDHVVAYPARGLDPVLE